MAHQDYRRLLLQSTDFACQQQSLAGISAGGWIALALFLGMFLGSSCTLLFQCWRRRREFRYMDKCSDSALRQSMVVMQALPPAPRTPAAGMQQTTLAATPGAATPPAIGSLQGPAGANKQYFSPLNQHKGHGSVALVHAQLSEMRSSMQLSSDNGGDLSAAASDQQAHRDKTGAVNGQGATAAALGQREREFSQHGMRLQQRSHAWGPAGPAAQGSGAAQPGTHSLAQPQISTGHLAGTQLPQELSSSVLSADGPLHAEDSNPAVPKRGPATAAEAAQAAASNSQLGSSQATGQQITAGGSGSSAAVAVSPRGQTRQQARLPTSPDKHVTAAAAGAEPRSSSEPKQAPSPSLAEIEDEYEDDDLDDDWRALLGGVDARLKLQGARPMNARERAVAIKKLLVATGTRGVEFALNSTIQEVLNFRQIHGH